jgi:hypothetical protein
MCCLVVVYTTAPLEGVALSWKVRQRHGMSFFLRIKGFN